MGFIRDVCCFIMDIFSWSEQGCVFNFFYIRGGRKVPNVIIDRQDQSDDDDDADENDELHAAETESKFQPAAATRKDGDDEDDEQHGIVFYLLNLLTYFLTYLFIKCCRD